jgi:hypothetical protein
MTLTNQNYLISRPIRRIVIFSLQILEKINNDECILISVIYWKKTGLLHTKISNNLFIIETQKIVVTATKIIIAIKMYNICTSIYKFGNNTYPRCRRRRSNLGHIFRKKVRLMGQENMVDGLETN